MAIVNRVAAMQDEIALWRRDFHAHPETGYDVQRTAGIVAEKLKAFGCDEVVPGIGKTGVVGVIRGRKGGLGQGDRAARRHGRAADPRGDRPALRLQDPGKMHACGHDGHTAMLLGAAKYLAETRNFDGTAVVIFQPAEEGGGGGRAMVDDGLMERFGIQEVYGMHNWPGMPVGKFAICPGPMLAASDEFEVDDHRQGRACGAAAREHRSGARRARRSSGVADDRLAQRRPDRRGAWCRSAWSTPATRSTSSPRRRR